MFNKIAALSAFCLQVSSADGEPPTSGKFFYVDLVNHEPHGLVGIALSH